jgi:hypothetical protein
VPVYTVLQCKAACLLTFALSIRLQNVSQGGVGGGELQRVTSNRVSLMNLLLSFFFFERFLS